MAAAAQERLQRIHPTLDPTPVFTMTKPTKNDVDLNHELADEEEGYALERVMILDLEATDGSMIVTDMPQFDDAGKIQTMPKIVGTFNTQAMTKATKSHNIHTTQKTTRSANAQAMPQRRASHYPNTPAPFIHFASRVKRFSHLFKEDPLDPLVERPRSLLHGTPPKRNEPCSLKVKTCIKPDCPIHVLQTPTTTILRNSLARLMPNIYGALRKEQKLVKKVARELMCTSFWDDEIQPLCRRCMRKAQEYHDLNKRLWQMAKEEIVANKINEEAHAAQDQLAQAV